MKDYVVPFFAALVIGGIALFVVDFGLMNLQGVSLFFHR